jgi:Tat protein translocase TatB subunit
VFGHFPELIIVLVIALIVFGPEKLPEAAANAGKMFRELRTIMDTAMNPIEEEIPDDFSSYYYESLSRAGEEVPEEYEVEEPYHNYLELDDADEEMQPDDLAAEAGASPTNGKVDAGTRKMVTRVVRPRSRPPA